MLNFKQVIGLGLTDYGQHHLGQVHDQGDLEPLRDTLNNYGQPHLGQVHDQGILGIILWPTMANPTLFGFMTKGIINILNILLKIVT